MCPLLMLEADGRTQLTAILEFHTFIIQAVSGSLDVFGLQFIGPSA